MRSQGSLADAGLGASAGGVASAGRVAGGAVSRRSLLQGLAALTGMGALVALSGCQGAPVPVPSDDHAEDVAMVVRVGDNFYDPPLAEISAGQAVRWEWVGRELHDVVANDRSFVTELMREGTYTHIFETAGEFAYICSVHPEMRGVVSVA